MIRIRIMAELSSTLNTGWMGGKPQGGRHRGSRARHEMAQLQMVVQWWENRDQVGLIQHVWIGPVR